MASTGETTGETKGESKGGTIRFAVQPPTVMDRHRMSDEYLKAVGDMTR